MHKNQEREGERDRESEKERQKRVNNQVALLTARASVDNNKMKCNGHGQWVGRINGERE